MVIKSYEDVTFVGATSTSFSRDFTNSRAQIRGSGGTVYFEAGDPTGDDTGGKWRVGGWNGTQADTGYLDAAVVDTSGTLTERTKKLAGVVATEGSFAAVATADIPLVQTPFTGVRAWEVEIIDLVFGGAVSIRTGYGAGPTFDTGAHYNYTTNVNGTGASASNQTSIAALTGTASGADAGYLGLRVVDISGGIVHGSGYYHGSTSGLQTIISAINFNPPAGGLTYLRFTPAAGTITFRYRVVPLRGFGEV